MEDNQPQPFGEPRSGRWNTARRWLFVAILAAYAVYAGIYIVRTSFVVDGQRYFVLFDDAMISMRYARNLVRGEGLVWNAGQRVEGFSNPLWVLLMAVFHLFPIPATLISLPVQICGGLFLMGGLYCVKRIGQDLSGSAGVGLLAALLTAFYAPLSTWSLLGMEVSAAILITALAVWMAVRMLHGQAAFSGWLYVLLGVGTLLRLDMLVQYLAIGSFLAWADTHNRRRHVLWGLGMLGVFFGGQTVLRWLYYGELLPNTYYLKVNGVSALFLVRHGLTAFLQFVWNFNPVFFVLPLVVAAVVAFRSVTEPVEPGPKSPRMRSWLFPRSRAGLAAGLLAWVFLAGCAYSIYVGGDAWEEKGGANRFISTGIPLLFLLLAYALDWWKRQDQSGREALLGFGMLAWTYLVLLNLRYVAKPDYLRYWAIANGVVIVLAILAVASLAFPHHRQGMLWAGTVVYIIYFVVEGVIRRQEIAGDILPGRAGGTVLVMLFNIFKVTAELFVGRNAPLFLLPLVLVGLLNLPWGTGRKAHLVKSTGRWLIWGMFGLVLLLRLPNSDAWVSRVLSAYLPMGFLLVVEMGPPSGSGQLGDRVRRLGSLAWKICFALLYLVNINALLGIGSLKYWALLERHPFIPGSERYVRISIAIDRVMAPDAKVAVVTAGIIPYFTGRPAVDLMGKCDPVVARTPMQIVDNQPLVEYRPGHMKWDYAYSFGVLQPDLVAQLWGGYQNPTTLAYLVDYTKVYLDGFPIFVRNASPHILWEHIPPGQ